MMKHSHLGIQINLFVVDHTGGFVSLRLCGRDTTRLSFSSDSQLYKRLNMTNCHLHESEQQLAEVSRGVAFYVFIQISFEH